MTTAAQPARRATDGWVQIPSSIIENQSTLTRPELALSLIVIRKGGLNSPVATPVSDTNWQNWTGLSPRAKEYAEAGLRKKGTLSIEGRGKSARYRFDRAGWDNYVLHCGRSKPRTEGRRVDPKPGAQVHPLCREHGCAVLRSETGESGLIDLESAKLAQPVAQVVSIADRSNIGTPSGGVQVAPCGLRSVVATKLAQPVAQTSDLAEQVWSKALAVLRSIFPLVGVAFLVRLVAVCRALFADVTDDQLAGAIGLAWREKKATQKGEGLFLLTVPDALAHLRRVPDGARGPTVPRVSGAPPGSHNGARRLAERCAAALAAHGELFKAQISECSAIATSIETGADADFGSAGYQDIERLGELFQRLEDDIFAVACSALTREQRAEVTDHVRAELGRHGFTLDLKTPVQVETLGLTVKRGKTFELLAIPRLDLYYA